MHLQGAPGRLVGNDGVERQQDERIDGRKDKGGFSARGQEDAQFQLAEKDERAEQETGDHIGGESQIAGKEPLEVLPPGMDVPGRAR